MLQPRVHEGCRGDGTIPMEYITASFENTRSGLQRKDEYTRQLAQQAYRIITEQIEPGHIKGNEQCCWALVCLPGIFLASRTPGTIVVTYGKESPRDLRIGSPGAFFCNRCGASPPRDATFCDMCGAPVVQAASGPQNETRKCPSCAEMIQAAARKCRFCGESLEPQAPA